MSKDLVVVASHLSAPMESLDPPYIEVFREDHPSGKHQHSVSEIPGTTSPVLSWSEYGQFLYPFPLADNVETFGLMHYRCMLDLNSESPNNHHLPFSSRKSFTEIQADLFPAYRGKIIVGAPVNFAETTWKQFEQFHGGLGPILKQACEKFDSLVKFGFPSESILKSQHTLYSRNIFLAPVEFANLWRSIVLEMIAFLDLKAPVIDCADTYSARWGGFILERLFSLFVLYHKLTDPERVCYRQFVFFS